MAPSRRGRKSGRPPNATAQGAPAVTEREIEMNRGGGVGIIGVIVIVVVILFLLGVIKL